VKLEDKLLAALLLGGGYAPLSRLSGELGASETGLAEAARSLAARGYPVEVERELLKLHLLDDLSAAAPRAAKLGTSLRFSVHYLERCGSTMDVARELALGRWRLVRDTRAQTPAVGLARAQPRCERRCRPDLGAARA